MKRLLFKISRLKMLGWFVGLGITYFPCLIPVKRIKHNKKVFAFYHPVPSYLDHILVIPRKIARTIFQLSAEDFYNVADMALQIRANDKRDFVLLINGGKRQDVMQAHFHLYTGSFAQQKVLDTKHGEVISENSITFWKQFQNHLSATLQKNDVTEKCFSVLIQFKKGTEPMLYIV